MAKFSNTGARKKKKIEAEDRENHKGKKNAVKRERDWDKETTAR